MLYGAAQRLVPLGGRREHRLVDQDAARFRPLVAGDDAAPLEHVDQPSGARVAEPQPALQHGRGRGLHLRHEADGVAEQRVLVGVEALLPRGLGRLLLDLLDEVEPEAPDKGDAGEEGFDPDEDPLLGDAIQLVVEMGTASTSMLQRRLRLGYTRAGRLIDMLERRNVISGYEGSKPRQVLVAPADAERFIAAIRDGAGNSPAQEPVSVPDDADG
jgi:DNA segregation ATPase FtsK/SpoIIIE-like protein